MNPDSFNRSSEHQHHQNMAEIADIERALRVVLKAAIEEKLSPLAIQTLRATLDFTEISAA